MTASLLREADELAGALRQSGRDAGASVVERLARALRELGAGRPTTRPLTGSSFVPSLHHAKECSLPSIGSRGWR